MKYLRIAAADMRKARRIGNAAVGLPVRGVTVGPVSWTPPELQLDELGDYQATPGWTTDCYSALYLDGKTGALYVQFLPEYETAVDAVLAEVAGEVLDALPAGLVQVDSQLQEVPPAEVILVPDAAEI